MNAPRGTRTGFLPFWKYHVATTEGQADHVRKLIMQSNYQLGLSTQCNGENIISFIYNIQILFFKVII